MPVSGPTKLDDNKTGAEGGSARAYFGGGAALAIGAVALGVVGLGVGLALASSNRKRRR